MSGFKEKTKPDEVNFLLKKKKPNHSLYLKLSNPYMYSHPHGVIFEILKFDYLIYSYFESTKTYMILLHYWSLYFYLNNIGTKCGLSSTNTCNSALPF